MGRRNLIFTIVTVFFLLLFPSKAPCDEESGDSLDWLTDGEWSGEIGLRFKDANESGVDNYMYQLQLNIDYEAEINDAWEWAIGLRTGAVGRPTRGWVQRELFLTEQNFFIKPWILTHSGKFGSCDVDTTFGAFEYPFDQSGTLFDGDAIYPGITQEFNFDLDGGDVDLGWSAQHLRSGSETGDAYVIVGNVSWRFRTGNNSRSTFQLSYVDYIHIDTIGQAITNEDLFVSGHAPGIGTTNIFSNPGDLASDFNILFLRTEHEFRRGTYCPISFWAEYLKNLGAENIFGSRNTGWSAGIEMGDDSDAGDIQLALKYVTLEDDAVVEIFNRGKYGTNARGWVSDLRYCLTDNFMFRIEGFWLKTNSMRSDIDPFTSDIMQISLIYEF